MKRLLPIAFLVSLLAGSALAQEPPPPPGDDGPAMDDAGGPPAPPPAPMAGKGPKGMHGGRPGGGPRGERFPPPPSSKAARFTVDLGEGRRVDVKCAEDEPMKACADIAQAMLERIAPPRP